MSGSFPYVVLIISNTYGGVLTYTKNLINKIPDNQFNILPYFIAPSIEYQKNDLKQNQYFLTLKNFVPNPMSLFRFFNSNAQLIHSNFAGIGLLAVISKFLFKIPFVLTLHGFPEPRSRDRFFDKIKYSIEKKLISFVGSRTSALVVVSQFEKDLLFSNFGLNSEVIYHGIDLSVIKNFDKKWAKKELGYKETDFIVLFVGKLIPKKSPFTLIQSINYILNKHKDIKLLIVGSGILEESIRCKVKKLGLENYVKFFGYIGKEDLDKCYSAADLFVLPSINEPFGIVLLEAMAFGCPIIASNSGACPEVVGDSGLLFKQGDPKDLEKKILKVMTDFKLSQKMSKLGLERVSKVFSNEKHIKKHIKLYKSLLKTKD